MSDPDEQEVEIFELNAGSALGEAASTLFTARDKADMLNDTEGLLNVAAAFIAIYDRMSGKDDEEKDSKPFLGFGRGNEEDDEG